MSQRVIRTLFVLCTSALLYTVPSHAIDLERLVSPGKLIEGHAKVEKDCRRCHSPFDRGSEAGLCMDCHKEVAADLRDRKGFHGLQPEDTIKTCRSCHTEHAGRDADIVGLNLEAFDHGSTDYPLAGAHQNAECASCHPANEKRRDAARTCIGCHSEDDSHGGQLGEDCSKCHSENRWRESRFDHDTTNFRLERGHLEVDCVLCHTSGTYKGTVGECRGCHSVDDAHQGQFGAKCSDCHSAIKWKRGKFDHAARTKFPLRGKHEATACNSCHGVAGRGRNQTDMGSSKAKSRNTFELDMQCVSCHRADDEHRGNYGTACGDCHSEVDWRRIRFDHQRDTKFALSGAHREQSCESCHRGKLGEKGLLRNCYSCHASDDVHRKQEGEQCESCHDSSSWTENVAFDHDLTRFPLLGLHGLVPCEECHETMSFRDASDDCSACHAGNDVHHGTLGSDCVTCHNPNGWQLWRFDHRRQTRFELRGAHKNLDCRGCHDSPTKRGGKRETRCESCHGMGDPHRGSFGSRCEDCHLETSWQELRIAR